MSYSIDIFISYSHLDNERDPQGGWVDLFEGKFRERLQVFLGRKVSIWRDLRISRNENLDNALIKNIKASAVFLPILSPGYINSPWCLRELDEFLTTQTEPDRVFKVSKSPTPLESHPQDIRQAVGYEFFEVNESDGIPNELSPYFSDDSNQLFRKKVNQLAYEISQLLKTIQKAAPKESPPVQVPVKAKIFLAETSSDVAHLRQNIYDDLDGRKHSLLPETSLLNLPTHELRSTLQHNIQESDFSIHIVGGDYGLIPEEEEQSLVALALETAQPTNNTQASSCLIWIPDGIVPADKRQTQYLGFLRNEMASKPGVALLETKPETFKTYIQDHIQKIYTAHQKAVEDRQENPPPGPANDDLRYVYVICDKQDKDEEDFQALDNYLYEFGVEPITPFFQGDVKEVREFHEDNLRTCHGVLVYYGRGTGDWIKLKLNDLRKAPGLGRTRPFKAKAVYISAPKTQAKDTFRTREAQILRDGQGFNPELLQSFLDDLRA